MRQAIAWAAAGFALALSSGVRAEARTSSEIAGPEIAGSSMGAADIVARGHVRRPGWMTMQGPDAAGQYTVIIDIAGIDPATSVGWARISRRVDNGVGQLCDAVGARPLVMGYYDAVQRECLSRGRAMAQTQMEQARDAALRGERVAMLGVAFGG